MDFNIQGKKIEEQKQEVDDAEQFFQNQVLGPLPDYSFNPELKELALSI